jgi:hypothetical protein
MMPGVPLGESKAVRRVRSLKSEANSKRTWNYPHLAIVIYPAPPRPTGVRLVRARPHQTFSEIQEAA